MAALTITKKSTPTPLLTLSPTTGSKKTPVTVSGTGFTPGQTATVNYLSGRKKPKRATSTLCTATVASNGTFSCSGSIPKGRRAGPIGEKTVNGIVSSTTQATTTFNLT